MAYLRSSTGTVTGRTFDSPTLTTPALGTPSAGVVTNLSGVLPSGVTGGSGLDAIAAAKLPAGSVIQVVSGESNNAYSGAATGTSPYLSTFNSTNSTTINGGGSDKYDRAQSGELAQPFITTIRANSKILIFMYIGNVHVGSGSPLLNMSLERWKGSAEGNIVGEALVHGDGEIYGLLRMGYADEKTINITWLDTPADPAGTVLRYIQCFYIESGTMNLGGSSNYSRTTLMEIAV